MQRSGCPLGREGRVDGHERDPLGVVRSSSNVEAKRRHSSTASPHGRTPVRLIALSLAVVSVAAELASIAHVVFVRHATCPEHGELIHSQPRTRDPSEAKRFTRSSGPAHEAAIVPGREALPADPSYERRRSASLPHDSDHCVFTAFRREREGNLAPSSLLLLSAATRRPPSLARETPPRRRIALLLFAPKLSPPA